MSPQTTPSKSLSANRQDRQDRSIASNRRSMEVLMNAEPVPAASGEVYLNFENVSATVDHIKEASAWCKATRDTKASFTQAMDSKENPLGDWSRGNRYQG